MPQGIKARQAFANPTFIPLPNTFQFDSSLENKREDTTDDIPLTRSVGQCVRHDGMWRYPRITTFPGSSVGSKQVSRPGFKDHSITGTVYRKSSAQVSFTVSGNHVDSSTSPPRSECLKSRSPFTPAVAIIRSVRPCLIHPRTPVVSGESLLVVLGRQPV